MTTIHVLITRQKWKQSTTCYGEAMNSTWKTWLRFYFSIVYQIWWLNGNSNGFAIQWSWVRVPLWTRIFHSVILALRYLQLKYAHANEIKHDIHLTNTLFWIKVRYRKIWLPTPVVYKARSIWYSEGGGGAGIFWKKFPCSDFDLKT